ncbi:MAG: chromosome segregation protein SMC [Elusimicrobiales bacterium]
MYLKAIEISGFKSFADKARLDFKPGITCVIGPNGCGKSNVVDSIRWCIGEMSWKSLRSASMVDIIFNGTAKRQPTGMSEVNMIFDNEARRLPLDFSEIAVTRRIFRSGESEYFLNKTQCRLRDVRDLFLDTGIGGEGYAIIDQGGVEFVLSATPEMRRELFEEAAGVSKYKSRRDEAQRKLEKVDQDLARLMDAVVLIDEQIKKLDSEARKARLYQKNREELRESEIALAVSEADRHGEAASAATAKLHPINEAVSEKQGRVSALEGEVAALNLNLTHKQAQDTEFAGKISGAKYDTGKLEGEIAACDSSAAILSRQIGDWDNEDASSAARKAELEPAVERLRAQIAAAAESAAPLQKEYDEISAALETAETDITSAINELDAANAGLVEASRAELECSNRVALAQSAISHYDADLSVLDRETQQLGERAAQGARDIEAAEAELAALRAKLEQTRNNVQLLDSKKSVLGALSAQTAEKISACRSEKAALNATLETLCAQAEKDPYWLGARAVAEAEGSKGPLRKHLSFSDENKLFAEEALGPFMDAILCDSLDAARKMAEQVRAQGNARCRFLALNAVSQPAQPLPDEVKSRLSYPPELENLLCALLSGCTGQGSNTEGPFWLVAGADSVSPVQQYWGRQEEVRKALEAAAAQETALAAQSESVAGEVRAAEEELAAARAALGEETSRESILSAALEAKKQARANHEEELGLVEKEKTGIAAKREESRAALAAAEEGLQSRRARQTELKSAIEAVRSRRQALVEQAAAFKSRRDESGSRLSELRFNINGLEADLRMTASSLEEITRNFEKRAAQRGGARAKIEQCAAEKEQAQARLSSRRTELAELETCQAALREELAAMRGEYEEKSRIADNFRKELSVLELEAHDLSAQVSQRSAQRDEIARKLADEWQTTIEEARMKYGGVEVDIERVKMLRRRLESMGAVNMTAPEEYDALSQRGDFLRSQIGDLERAREDLKSAIARINAATRENFRHTYDAVREHFRRIYQTLFVGGEADLILTQPENLLETGVEIMAQPPGKKLQSISALSGGEKALTALALLFGFFCVNPSPFCIMDEADAPLDEANVERFVGLIKEFASKTQFIIITHNKRTMEAADVLYGVTMEEQGVSKVISVSLSRDGRPVAAVSSGEEAPLLAAAQ